MFALLRFLFFCALAVASGVFAVTIPVAGHTPAEHVRRLVHRVSGATALAPSPPPAPPRAAARKAPPPAPVLARKPAPRPPADDPTPEERAALDELIGQRTR